MLPRFSNNEKLSFERTEKTLSFSSPIATLAKAEIFVDLRQCRKKFRKLLFIVSSCSWSYSAKRKFHSLKRIFNPVLKLIHLDFRKMVFMTDKSSAVTLNNGRLRTYFSKWHLNRWKFHYVRNFFKVSSKFIRNWLSKKPFEFAYHH